MISVTVRYKMESVESSENFMILLIRQIDILLSAKHFYNYFLKCKYINVCKAFCLDLILGFIYV